MTWTKAIVTGASSGIGEAIARRLAADGTHVVLVARTKDRLDSLAGELGGTERATVHVADLGEPRDVAEVAQLIDTDPEIDLVVNNAGFGATGPVAGSELDGQLGQIDVNVRCLVQLSHAAAQAMAPRGSGAILNVSSVAGYSATPNSAVYAATKAFVTSFSQSLHSELKAGGVHVACIAPGFTRTEFQDRADYDASKLPDFLWQTADEVAEIALDAAAKNKALVVPGALNKMLVGSVKPLPSALQRRIAAAFGD
ncbi:MAG: short-chain dehydrogenase [Acidimicrobiales bacterium]|nr:MAG: short-chain dehydrogenase [Acidimicrobiales bacterium]